MTALGWWCEFNGKSGMRGISDQEDELWHYFHTVRSLGLWMRRIGLSVVGIALLLSVIHLATG